jgi:hypothetical protein
MTLYEDVPVGYGLVRHHWTDPSGTGHGDFVHGFANPAGTSALSLGPSFNNAMVISWITVATSEYTLASTYVYCNDGAGGNEYTFDSAVSGESVPPTLPPNMAVLMRKGTSMVGIRGRGYAYWPGIAVTAMNATRDGLTDAALANWITAGANYLDNVASFDCSMVLLHRPSKKEGAPPPPGPTVVGSFEPEQKFSSQRRRLRKVAHR